jgi:hypothetical protein
MRPYFIFFLVLLIAPATLAENSTRGTGNKTTADAPPPPPPETYDPLSVPDLPGAEYPEPEVTITTKGTEIHEEYRVNGRLYMIKVIPAKGKPYYLIDHEGSGQFRRSDFEPRIAIPMWVIKRF